MEHLGRLAFYEDKPNLWLIPAEGLNEVPGRLTHSSQYFALFTAIDMSVQQAHGSYSYAAELLEQGLAYFCAFGENCEELHDCVDHADVDRTRTHPEPDNDSVVMTTWHAKDTLQKALWFFLHCANPAGHYAYGCDSYIIAASERYLPTVKSLIPELIDV